MSGITTSDLPQPVGIHSADGASASITPYGAHLLSWAPAGLDERLFLSPRAEYRAGAAIRGGVPVIFPQFSGLGSLPKHGFARSSVWNLAEVKGATARFVLGESEATLKIWPQPFGLEYSVTVGGRQLEMRLAVTNRGEQAFAFTAALHTYLAVGDLAGVAVNGLQGCEIIDNAQGGSRSRMNDEKLIFSGEVDRVFVDIPGELRLEDGGRDTRIRLQGFGDVVIWNPGKEKCAGLADMEPEGYLRFVCVEAAQASRPVSLAPGATWQGTQLLEV